ncbi:MAG: TIGR02710 family CRISPR-associated CARF protein [bacterium]|nr:TIGR02710 family CRISPR-associated CARF protein [bacterium]
MLISVGTGETVAHGIIRSIATNNPTDIIFLVTRESESKTLPKIVNDRIMQGRNYASLLLADSDDFDAVATQVKQEIYRLRTKKPTTNIAIDFTSGTKAMSAALVYAGIECGVDSFSYISGRRDSNGKVISGEEKIIQFSLNRTYAKLLIRQAVELFNTFRYDSCIAFLQQVKPLTAAPEIRQPVSVLDQLAAGYSAWDRFDIKSAYEIFFALNKTDDIDKILRAWGIKSKFESHLQYLRMERDQQFSLHQAIDLFANAQRRAKTEKKFDDALARLYRLTEYLAQVRLAHYNLYKRVNNQEVDTEAIDLDRLAQLLPAQRLATYRNRTDPSSGKLRLALVESYRLLAELNDNLGKMFCNEYNQSDLKKLLTARNTSILAHGFQPIPESLYDQLEKKLERLIVVAFPEQHEHETMSQLLKTIQFPKISLEQIVT